MGDDIVAMKWFSCGGERVPAGSSSVLLSFYENYFKVVWVAIGLVLGRSFHEGSAKVWRRWYNGRWRVSG